MCDFDVLPFTGTGKISLLSLLGFDSRTPVAIFYDQLPYILSTLLNGITDPEIDGKIVKSLRYNNPITCSMMFDWLSDARVGLSVADYRTLKNFTCDLDPENFNVYTDFYMTETVIWKKPASKYRSFVVSLIGDLYDLAKAISLTIKNKIIIERPFSKQYLDDTLLKLTETLEIQYERNTSQQVKKGTTINHSVRFLSTNRVLVVNISASTECSRHKRYNDWLSFSRG